MDFLSRKIYIFYIIKVLRSRNYLFSAPAPAPALYCYFKNGKFLCFNNIKTIRYYKSNIIKGISERWLEA